MSWWPFHPSPIYRLAYLQTWWNQSHQGSTARRALLLDILTTFHGSLSRAHEAYPTAVAYLNERSKMQLPALDYISQPKTLILYREFETQMSCLISLEDNDLEKILLLPSPPDISISSPSPFAASSHSNHSIPDESPAEPTSPPTPKVQLDRVKNLYKYSKFSDCGHQSSQLNTSQGYEAICTGQRVAVDGVVSDRNHAFKCKQFETCRYESDTWEDLQKHIDAGTQIDTWRNDGRLLLG